MAKWAWGLGVHAVRNHVTGASFQCPARHGAHGAWLPWPHPTHLLVAPLHGAVALVEVHHVAVVVRDDLPLCGTRAAAARVRMPHAQRRGEGLEHKHTRAQGARGRMGASNSIHKRAARVHCRAGREGRQRAMPGVMPPDCGMASQQDACKVANAPSITAGCTQMHPASRRPIALPHHTLSRGPPTPPPTPPRALGPNRPRPSHPRFARLRPPPPPPAEALFKSAPAVQIHARLDLDVARLLHVLLHEHAAVAKGRLGLIAGTQESLGHLGLCSRGGGAVRGEAAGAKRPMMQLQGCVAVCGSAGGCVVGWCAWHAMTRVHHRRWVCVRQLSRVGPRTGPIAVGVAAGTCAMMRAVVGVVVVVTAAAASAA